MPYNNDYFDRLREKIADYIDKEVIDKEEQYIKRKLKERKTKRVYESIKYVMSPRGHYWRPLMTLTTAESYRVSNHVAMPYATAIECAHRATLVLDDLPCMDSSQMRHGQESCHIRFNEAIAILAAYELSVEKTHTLIKKGSANSDIKEKIRNELFPLAQPMVYGQEIDLYGTHNADLDKLLEMYELKTGRLFAGAAVIGGILGNATKNQITHLKWLGISAGIAYQLIDDLHDIGYLKENHGKPRHQDVRKTTPIDLIGTDGVVKLVETHKKKINRYIKTIEKSTRKDFSRLEEMVNEMLRIE